MKPASRWCVRASCLPNALTARSTCTATALARTRPARSSGASFARARCWRRRTQPRRYRGGGHTAGRAGPVPAGGCERGAGRVGAPAAGHSGSSPRRSSAFADAGRARPEFPLHCASGVRRHTQIMRVDGVGRYELLGENATTRGEASTNRQAAWVGPGGSALSRMVSSRAMPPFTTCRAPCCIW